MVVSDERRRIMPSSPPSGVCMGSHKRLPCSRSNKRGSGSVGGSGTTTLSPTWATALQEDVAGLRGVLMEQSSRYEQLLEEKVSGLQQEYNRERFVSSHRSVLLDLLLFLDKMNYMYKEEKSGSSTSSGGAADLLRSLSEELAMILYRCDVEPMHTTSPKFDERVQRAVEVVPTDAVEENGKVLGVVRHGFWHGNRVLRLEDVIVSRYENRAVPAGE